MKQIIDKADRPVTPYRPGEHGSLDTYISLKNIEQFGKRLKTEFDPKIRQMVGRLLEIEKAKWATPFALKVRSKEIKRKAAVFE